MKVFADPAALSEAVAQAVVREARASIAARGRFRLALSGGETPRAAYELLGTRHARDVAWDQVDLCFTDERFVPPDDAHSNFGMVRRTLLSRIAMPPDRVHAIPTEQGTPDECAARYDDHLRALFGRPDDAQATFDLTIMGIGTDGHTASLFPGDADALEETERWVLAVAAPPTVDVSQRITLTLPLLNRSRVMLFAASGEKKRAMVALALRSGSQSGAIPAALAHGVGRTDWYLDQAAAPPSP